MKYTLKVYDQPLLSFDLAVSPFGVTSVDNLEYVGEPEQRILLPLPLVNTTTPPAVLEWLKNRTVPKNRAYVEQLFNQAGITEGDLVGLLDICKGLSVNDAYWVDDGTGKSFDEINLYENEFDEALALTAYTGYTSSQKRKIGLSSEWTTSGQFPKAWRRIDGEVVLYKSGAEGAANLGKEPFAEVLACQVADKIGIDHVDYSIDVWHGKVASTCTLLNDRNTSLVSFWDATRNSLFPVNLAIASRMGDRYFEGLRDIFEFDALIMNTDRHATNIGFLRDNETGAIFDIAPAYDHNLALFIRDMPSDYDGWIEKSDRTLMCTANLSFNGYQSLTMSEKGHERARALLDFEFEPITGFQDVITEEMLAHLSALVQHRARVALRAPVVSVGELRRTLEKEITPSVEAKSPVLASPCLVEGTSTCVKGIPAGLAGDVPTPGKDLLVATEIARATNDKTTNRGRALGKTL